MSKYDYYAASVWPRWGEVLVTFVALRPGPAEEAAEKAAEYERNETWTYAEEGHREGPCDQTACPYCDILAGIETRHPADHLFTAKELNEHRRDLIKGEVVALYP